MFRLAACNRNYVPSIIPIETTNTLCTTTKKNNVFSSTKTIQIGNILYTVPCFLVNHIDELKQLLTTMNISDAIALLATKYGVNINPVVKNVKRYKYSIVSLNFIPNVIQFKESFKLQKLVNSSEIEPISGLFRNKFTCYPKDARYISICNDNTTTFSTFIPDIEANAIYWWSTLPKTPNFYVVINNTKSNNELTTQSGYIRILNNRLAFVPLIKNEFVFLYKPYAENTSFKFLYSGDLFDAAISTVKDIVDSTQDSCTYRITS